MSEKPNEKQIEKQIDALMPEFNDDILEGYQEEIKEDEKQSEEEWEAVNLPEEKPVLWEYEKESKIVGKIIDEGTSGSMKVLLMETLDNRKLFIPKWKALESVQVGEVYMLVYKGKTDNKLHDVSVFIKKKK